MFRERYILKRILKDCIYSGYPQLMLSLLRRLNFRIGILR